MKQNADTVTSLIAAGRELFAAHGFRGASIRAITRLAGANLGAVTYHFGSKERLYDTVAAAVAEPFRAHVAGIAQGTAPPLQRLDALVRGVFEYLWDHPELPQFMVQQLAGSRPVPPAVRRTIEANHGVIARLIAEGQREGSIRDGDPRLMALSIVAQPLWLNALRLLLRQTLSIDQENPATRAALVDTVARLVHVGLAARQDSDS